MAVARSREFEGVGRANCKQKLSKQIADIYPGPLKATHGQLQCKQTADSLPYPR